MEYKVIPFILMFGLILGHTIAIKFLKKRRDALDAAAPDAAGKVKTLNLIITILYLEIPVITALIWFVVAPMIGPVDN